MRLATPTIPVPATLEDVMRHSILACALALPLLATAAPPARGQVTEAQPGARVRLSAPGVVAGSYVGTVLAREPGIMRVGSQDTAPIDVPLGRITSLEISKGKSHSAGAARGVVIGGVIGLALGVVAAVSDPDSRTYFNYDTGRRDTTSRGAIVAYTTFSGALLGAGIGALIPKERWERFDLAPRTSMDPRRRRMELGLSIGY
jgi:hypothetical protein